MVTENRRRGKTVRRIPYGIQERAHMEGRIAQAATSLMPSVSLFSGSPGGSEGGRRTHRNQFCFQWEILRSGLVSPVYLLTTLLLRGLIESLGSYWEQN